MEPFLTLMILFWKSLQTLLVKIKRVLESLLMTFIKNGSSKNEYTPRIRYCLCISSGRGLLSETSVISTSGAVSIETKPGKTLDAEGLPDSFFTIRFWNVSEFSLIFSWSDKVSSCSEISEFGYFRASIDGFCDFIWVKEFWKFSFWV